jgi:hypothetical protein
MTRIGKKSCTAFHEEILAGSKDEPGAFDELLEKLGLTEKFAATFDEEAKDGTADPMDEIRALMAKVPIR